MTRQSNVLFLRKYAIPFSPLGLFHSHHRDRRHRWKLCPACGGTHPNGINAGLAPTWVAARSVAVGVADSIRRSGWPLIDDHPRRGQPSNLEEVAQSRVALWRVPPAIDRTDGYR